MKEDDLTVVSSVWVSGSIPRSMFCRILTAMEHPLVVLVLSSWKISAISCDVRGHPLSRQDMYMDADFMPSRFIPRNIFCSEMSLCIFMASSIKILDIPEFCAMMVMNWNSSYNDFSRWGMDCHSVHFLIFFISYEDDWLQRTLHPKEDSRRRGFMGLPQRVGSFPVLSSVP